MSTNPIKEYNDALQKFQYIKTLIERMVDKLKSISEKLNADWSSVYISDTDVSLPAFWGQGVKINPKDWPTAGEMTVALKRYHETKLEVRNAYWAIPDEDRSGIKKPPPEITA